MLKESLLILQHQRNLLFLGFVLLCLPCLAPGQTLEYQLNELPIDVSENINAHLGASPETELERTSFVYTTDQRLQSALTALGYYHSDISIGIDRSTDIWQMRIEVILNEVVLIDSVEVNISGDANSDEEFIELLANIPLLEGETLHHGKYEQFKSAIRTLGVERGYFDGQFSNTQIAINENQHTASILINYASGSRYRFGEVSFDQTGLSDSLLAQLIPFDEGEYYQTSSLYRLQNQLQKTGYFSSTLVLPDQQNAVDLSIPIKVNTSNISRHSFDLGAGFATDTGFRLSAGWRMPLVNQKGHSLETKLEYSQVNPIGRFTYSIPLTHPINDILQFQLILEDDEYGDINSKYLSTKIGRLIRYDSWVGNYYLRHLNEEWNIDQDYDDAQYVLPGISFSKIRREGSVLDPSSGFSQLYTMEAGHSSLGSEISLLRLTARWKWVNTLNSRHRFVARAELGSNIISSDDDFDLAPSLRFYAGGDQSLRGFKYQSLGPSITIENGPNAGEEIVIGGQNLAVASLEYQYYFKPKWRIAFFSDVGNAFDDSDFEVEYSVGTGLHWISSVGAIRFDLGYSLSEEDPSFRIHINIGAEL